MKTINILDDVELLINNGNWKDATIKYKNILKISPQQFNEWLRNKNIEIIKDFALLGFYSREI